MLALINAATGIGWNADYWLYLFVS